MLGHVGDGLVVVGTTPYRPNQSPEWAIACLLASKMRDASGTQEEGEEGLRRRANCASTRLHCSCSGLLARRFNILKEVSLS